MGDRCYMEVTTLEEHRKGFEDLGFDEVDEEHDGIVKLVDQAANGAPFDEMPTGVNGIPYISYNAAGCAYGEYGTVCDGENYLEISVNREFIPVVEIENDGKIQRGQWKNIREWLKIKKKVELIFKMRMT